MVVRIMRQFLLAAPAAIAAILFALLPSLHALIRMDEAVAAVNGGAVYYNIQLEDSPFDTEITEFNALYRALSEEFEYYEFYRQYLECVPGEASPFENLEDGIVPCVQISRNVPEAFGLALSSGRLFREEEYWLRDGAPIPVILGAAHDNLEIGGVFSCHYLFDAYDFCVIGFLEPGAVIDMGDMVIPLDDHVLMPSFQIALPAPVTDGQIIHYANKTSGLVRTSRAENQETLVALERLLEEYGTYSITCSSIDISLENRLGIGLKELLFAVVVMALLLLIAAIFLARKWLQNEGRRRCLPFYGASLCITAALWPLVMAFVVHVRMVHWAAALALEWIVIGLVNKSKTAGCDS